MPAGSTTLPWRRVEMPTIFQLKSRRSAVSPSSFTNRRATLPKPIRTSVSSGWYILGGCDGCRQRCQKLLQPIEAGAVVLGRLAEAKPQVAVHAEVIARHDEHALLLTQSIHERRRID